MKEFDQGEDPNSVGKLLYSSEVGRENQNLSSNQTNKQETSIPHEAVGLRVLWHFYVVEIYLLVVMHKWLSKIYNLSLRMTDLI